MTELATPEEITQHRRATSFGFEVGRWLMVTAVLVMFAALSILFYQQEQYQRCVADFQDSESQARIARTAASAENTKALTDAFLQASEVIDPSKTPSMKQVVDLQAALKDVPAKQKAYEKSIAQYPYQDFSKVCPS